MKRALLAVLLALGLAPSSWAASPAVQATGGDTQVRSYSVTFSNGDSGDSASIPNRCATWRLSFYVGSGGGGVAQVYAVRNPSDGTASGSLLATLSATSPAVTTVETAWPALKVKVGTAPAAGTPAQLWLYCTQEARSGAAAAVAATTYKVAEDYAGADFSAQLEAASAAAPAGGRVLITQSHTVTTTANLDDANATIECNPDVVLTAGAGSLRMISLEAANIIVRDCHFEGAKATYLAHAIAVLPAADGAKILRNRMLDFKGRGVYLDPDAALTTLSDVVIEDNVIDNSVTASIGVQTFGDIYGPNGIIVPRIKIVHNRLVSRDCGGDSIFLFMGIGSNDGLIDGNYMDIEGCGDTAALRATACSELALAGASIPGGGFTTADFLTGWRVNNNVCVTRDFTFQGMAPVGMSHGSTFVGNTLYDLGTDTTSTQTRYATEVGNTLETTLTGNAWNGNGRGRSIYLHDSENVVISGNTFNYQRSPVVGADEAIRLEDTFHGTDSLLAVKHIIIEGNTFQAPTPASGTNIATIAMNCDGSTTGGTGGFAGTTGVSIDDVTIGHNTFIGGGAGAGGAWTAVLDLQELGTDGNCPVTSVRLLGNRIDAYDYLANLNANHSHDDISILDNQITNLGTGYFQFQAGATLTNALVNGAGTDAPVTGTQCKDGSLWVDTDGSATGTNCSATAAGSVCSCAGAAWTVH